MELPSAPHQPKSFDFPKRSFGKKVIVKRSFQASWFDRWSWLHYIENNVMVLHVHKNQTDKLSLVDIGNNFISGSSHRVIIWKVSSN